MRSFFKPLSLAIAVCVLTACGGGGDGGNNGNSGGGNNFSDAQIRATLDTGNIGFLVGNAGRPAGTWRWQGSPQPSVQVFIPSPSSAIETDYANKVEKAIALINQKLAGKLQLSASNSAPATGNYIQISYGTSFVPNGSTDYAGYCANVSTAPNLGNMISPSSSNAIATQPVYINLGNGHCDVTQDIVTHEFGHALGLPGHFVGFGEGPAISGAYWDVLATLYGNPASTKAADLQIVRAAP